LAQRIEVAATLGILTRDERRRADTARNDGNLVVHEFPSANVYHKTSLEMIASVDAVLKALLRDKRA
jgi:hypothetical protein